MCQCTNKNVIGKMIKNKKTLLTLHTSLKIVSYIVVILYMYCLNMIVLIELLIV